MIMLLFEKSIIFSQNDFDKIFTKGLLYLELLKVHFYTFQKSKLQFPYIFNFKFICTDLENYITNFPNFVIYVYRY